MRIAEQAALRIRTPYALADAFGPRLGVTVRAGLRDFNTAPPRIERVIGPLDGRVFAHRRETYREILRRGDPDLWASTPTLPRLCCLRNGELFV